MAVLIIPFTLKDSVTSLIQVLIQVNFFVFDLSVLQKRIFVHHVRIRSSLLTRIAENAVSSLNFPQSFLKQFFFELIKIYCSKYLLFLLWASVGSVPRTPDICICILSWLCWVQVETPLFSYTPKSQRLAMLPMWRDPRCTRWRGRPTPDS